MRSKIIRLLMGGAALFIPLSSSPGAPTLVAMADTPVATAGGVIVTGGAVGLSVRPAPGPIQLDSTVSTDSAVDILADPSGPAGNTKTTFWGYEAAFGGARVLTYQLGAGGGGPVTPGLFCIPTLSGGAGLTANGRGLAFDPLDGNLWISRLTVFAGDGKIYKIVPPNVNPTCPEVTELVVHSPDGKPVQDDFGALDADASSKHIWAAGYKPVSIGGVDRSYFYLINRNNGLVLHSCWIPFRGGGVGNDTLASMRLKGVFPGSGDYIMSDAGELTTTPNSVAVIDTSDCHNGKQVTPVAELPKGHAITGLDYEWPGARSDDNIEGGFFAFYADNGAIPAFTPANIIGSTGPSFELEDISLCGYHATFGGQGNDMCPYP